MRYCPGDVDGGAGAALSGPSYHGDQGVSGEEQLSESGPDHPGRGSK